VPSPAKGQPFEMQASAIKVIGWVDDPTPIDPAQAASMEFLREVAHLRPRTNVIGAATRVRHTLAQAIHRLLRPGRLRLGLTRRSSPPPTRKGRGNSFAFRR